MVGRLGAVCGVLVFAVPARADTALIAAAKDNTLIENANGLLSNGSGFSFFAGRTNQFSDSIRRGLIEFDVAAVVPTGATITSVQLRLTMVQTTALDEPIELHRVLAEWGESTSNGSGAGAPAVLGDATWTNTFYDSQFWMNVGGDFAPAVSATQIVGGPGSYAWATPEMVADVQAWLDAPSSNHGWLLLGNESVSRTAKAFASREYFFPENRPLLVVDYTPQCLPCDADCSNAVNLADLPVFVNLLLAIGTPCRACTADTDGNGQLNGADVQGFVACLVGP